jgi:hypothetical protein
MMSEVDPSLELQHLAAEALNYQAAQLLQQQQQQQQQQQLQQQQSTHPIVTHIANVLHDPEARFICPFPTCNRLYKRKDLLKRHLTTLLASPDENHHDQAIWEDVRNSGVMTVYTRPRNLTEDQKRHRRRESNLRHRVKYATELKEKRNRKRRVEKLLEGKQVGVQTPDWDAEARAMAMASEPIPVPVRAGTPVQQTEVPQEVQPRSGRRTGRSKQ